MTQQSDTLLIGDKYGRHAILYVDRTCGTILTLVALGEVCRTSRCLAQLTYYPQASSPTTLTYLANQVIYLGSHFGDSQLLQISPSPIFGSDCRPTLPIPASVPKPKDDGIIVNGNGSHLIELERFSNIAPIVDGILVDVDDSGQVRNILGLGAILTLFTE